MKRSVLLVLLLSASLLADEPAADRVGTLADVRWQILLRSVEGVFVGPDGRTWYQCDPDAEGFRGNRGALTVAAVKRRIEQEFHKDSPRIDDVRLALFEPGGRVWFSFSMNAHLMLLGYDGKTWTDYTILQRGDMIAGHCATRGALLDGRANRFAGGAAWFITFRGLLRFDGERWHYQKFADRPDQPIGFGSAYPDDAIWLAVSPDGQAAVAYAGATGEFWAFQTGEWRKFDFVMHQPEQNPGSRYRHNGLRGLVMPEAQTAWIMNFSGVLQRISLETPGKPEPSVGELILALKDDRFEAREEAAWQLEAMGRPIQHTLEQALADSNDLEQQARLKSIMDRIKRNAPQAIESVVGSVRVSGCGQLYEDGAGRVFVTASKINGQVGGVVIAPRAGKAKVLEGEPFSTAWAMFFGDDRPPIFAPSGDQIWLSNRGTTEPPRLLDLKKEAFVDLLPHPEFNRLHAVSEGGRVFASVSMPQGVRTIGVYTPGATETEPPLEISQVPALSADWAITDVGAVWVRGQEGLARFDGFQWTDIRPSRKEEITAILPGNHDAMLLWSEHSATLFQGTHELGAGERFAMLQQHRPRIQKAFGAGEPGERRVFKAGAEHCGVRVDRAGNLWCWEPSGRLLVETGGVWSDADEALTEAGARAGHVIGAELVGNGSKLYVRTNDVGRIGGSAFFADLKDGKPRCAAAPRDVDWFHPYRNLFDRDGGFWIGSSTKGGTVAHRVGPDGKVEPNSIAGLPALADEAGNVWLCQIRGPIQNTFHIWNQGKLVQKLAIPGADLHTFLFSDRAGSVYAWTETGLRHFVADGPNFDCYQPGKVYPVEGILGQVLSKGYSQHGYLAILTAMNARNAPYYRLYLVRLPK